MHTYFTMAYGLRFFYSIVSRTPTLQSSLVYRALLSGTLRPHTPPLPVHAPDAAAKGGDTGDLGVEGSRYKVIVVISNLEHSMLVASCEFVEKLQSSTGSRNMYSVFNREKTSDQRVIVERIHCNSSPQNHLLYELPNCKTVTLARVIAAFSFEFTRAWICPDSNPPGTGIYFRRTHL